MQKIKIKFIEKKKDKKRERKKTTDQEISLIFLSNIPFVAAVDFPLLLFSFGVS